MRPWSRRLGSVVRGGGRRGASARLPDRNLTAPSLAWVVTLGSSPTITHGTWTNAPTLTYDLYRDGVLTSTVDRTLAQANAYVAVGADMGAVLKWREKDAAAGLYAETNTVQWTPLSPATPAWWLRGDTVTLNGGTVSSWLDKSGNGRHWSQGSAPLQPTYTASAINGQPGLTFSAAATQELVGPDLNAVALTGGETFIVFQLNADPPATAAKCGFWRTESAASVSVVPFTDGVIYDGFGSTVRKTTVNPTPSLASPRIYSVISTASEWTSSLDGTQIFTTATNAVGWNTATRIGSSVTNFFDGVMCEWIVYGAKLSAGNRADVIAYLKARYGIA